MLFITSISGSGLHTDSMVLAIVHSAAFQHSNLGNGYGDLAALIIESDYIRITRVTSKRTWT